MMSGKTPLSLSVSSRWATHGFGHALRSETHITDRLMSEGTGTQWFMCKEGTAA